MKSQQHGTFIIMLMAMILVVLLPLAVGCDPPLVLEFENRTDQVLTIFVDGERIDDVKPGETIKRETVTLVSNDYLIEAQNDKGEVVYSEVLTILKLSEVQNSKIVISPSPE